MEKYYGNSRDQILVILRQAEMGVSIAELCRQHGMSCNVFYQWREKYAGTDSVMLERMQRLDEENQKLKQMYAEERMKNA